MSQNCPWIVFTLCWYIDYVYKRRRSRQTSNARLIGDSAKQIPNEVQLFLLMSYFVLGNVYWTFNLQAVFCLFETLKMFFPRRDSAKQKPKEVQLFLLVLFSVRKRIYDCQFTDGFLPFWDLENVLSPQGTLQSRYRRRSNCFYLCLILRYETYIGLSICRRLFAFLRPWKYFIPRTDSAKQIPKDVQLFLLMSYFVLGNVYCTFNLTAFFFLFETLKMFYLPKGLCKADTEGGPIVFTYVLFCVRKRILNFQFCIGNPPF